MWMELSLSKWSLLCFFSLNGCFYARLFIEVTLVIYIPNCLMDVNMLNYFVTSKWNEPSIIHWKNLLCVMLIDNWLLIKDCSVKTSVVSNPKIMNLEAGELDKPKLSTIMFYIPGSISVTNYSYFFKKCQISQQIKSFWRILFWFLPNITLIVFFL